YNVINITFPTRRASDLLFHPPPTHRSSTNRRCPAKAPPVALAGVPREAPRLSAPATVSIGPRCTQPLSRARGDARLPNRPRCDRSEEHTSELQSLDHLV